MVITELKLVDRTEQQRDLLEMLDDIRAEVVAGNITHAGVVFCRLGGEWGTVFSRSNDSRLDAAMLIELGLRRLGFKKS